MDGTAKSLGSSASWRLRGVASLSAAVALCVGGTGGCATGEATADPGTATAAEEHPAEGGGVLSPGETEPREAAVAAVSEVTPGSAATLSRELSAAAVRECVRQGLDARRAASLQRDAEPVVRAVLASDFTAYHAHMTSKGLSLTARARGKVETELQSKRYDEATKAALRQASLEEQLAYFWTHPSARNAEIVRLDVGGVSCGTGWTVTGDAWAATGLSGQVCMYLPGESYEDLLLRAQYEKAPAWWMEWPVVLNKGARGLMRLTFAYEESQDAWLPLRLDFPMAGVVPML